MNRLKKKQFKYMVPLQVEMKIIHLHLLIIKRLVANMQKSILKTVIYLNHHIDNFYLKDLGSKGGTFIKVRNNFMVEPDMSIYVGNKFAFKVVEMTQQVF